MVFSRIKEQRTNAGLTQAQLAQELGVQRAVVSKYETGMVTPPLEQLQSIARALGTTTAYLVGDTDIPTKAQPMKGYREMTQQEKQSLQHAQQAMGDLAASDEELFFAYVGAAKALGLSNDSAVALTAALRGLAQKHSVTQSQLAALAAMLAQFNV